MSGASTKGGNETYGLTPREIELTIKAMITMLEAGAKPDFEKLAKMTHYDNATTACKNWSFTANKLKAAGSKTDGEANGNNKAVGKKRGKRQAVDAAAAPAAKRVRIHKNKVEEEDQASGMEAEADEN